VATAWLVPWNAREATGAAEIRTIARLSLILLLIDSFSLESGCPAQPGAGDCSSGPERFIPDQWSRGSLRRGDILAAPRFFRGWLCVAAWSALFPPWPSC